MNIIQIKDHRPMVVGGLVNTCALSAFPVGGLRIEFPGRLSTSIVVGVCK